MATMSKAMSVAGSVAPATTLSSSAAFKSSQQLGVVRSPAARFHGSRMVAVRASQSSNEERSPKALVALVAAGAALALTVAPMSPAHAGLFGSDNVKVERGATAPDFPGNEGTGTKVGANSDVRGSANSGTPLGEGAGGNLVGENQATRQASSTGTPLGEGNMSSGSGSGVGVNLEVPNPLNNLTLPDPSNILGDAKDAAQNLAGDAKSKLPGDAGSVASNAKDAAQDLAGDAKSKLPGDAGSVASNAKDAAQNLAGDAKSKLPGGLPDAGSVASNAKDMAGDAKNKLGGGGNNLVGSAKDLAGDVANSGGAKEAATKVEGAKSSFGLPNPFDAGKSLMNKVTGN